METGTALSRIPTGKDPLALICGLPTSPTRFAAEVCRDLLYRRHGACEVVDFNDLGPDTLERVTAAVGPTLFLAEVPEPAVVGMLRTADFPIFVLDCDFSAACRDFMGARHVKLSDTVRVMSRAQIALQAIADIPRAVTIAVSEHESAALLVERIASALGIEDETWRTVVDERDFDHPLPQLLDTLFGHDKLVPSDEVDSVLGKIEGFYGISEARGTGIGEVPLDLLLEGEPPHLPATNTLELVGPARCLTFGPYLCLPAGRWRLRLRFTASANASTNTLGFDVTADEEVKVSQDYVVATAGKFEFTCDFQIEDAFYPFEFRTYLRRGAIEGSFSPTSLVLEPTA